MKVKWLAKEASYSARETVAVVHNPMGEEELKRSNAVGTKAGDEEGLAKQQEAPVLQSCNCSQSRPQKNQNKNKRGYPHKESVQCHKMF